MREREDELTAVTLSRSGGLLGAIIHVQKIIMIMTSKRIMHTSIILLYLIRQS